MFTARIAALKQAIKRHVPSPGFTVLWRQAPTSFMSIQRILFAAGAGQSPVKGPGVLVPAADTILQCLPQVLISNFARLNKVSIFDINVKRYSPVSAKNYLCFAGL